MASNLILGAKGFGKLILGYERNANQVKTRAFTVASTETNGILPGDLLAVTGATQVYKKLASTTDKIAGIALATNVKVDRYFPQSEDGVKFDAGDKGAAVIYGDVAVKLYGTAPSEGDAVYYNLTQGAFTKDSEGNVAFPGARFTGETEGDVTVIFVQYI
jgi:hypothetical protein